MQFLNELSKLHLQAGKLKESEEQCKQSEEGIKDGKNVPSQKVREMFSNRRN